jgi:uncharacterized membrane protein
MPDELQAAFLRLSVSTNHGTGWIDESAADQISHALIGGSSITLM